MTKYKGLNSTSLRFKNQMLILEKIKDSGRISRAKLSKDLALSAPSISANIQLLLDKGIIHEAGVDESSGGRKPVALMYNYDFCYLIGITLKEDELRGALTNLNGEIIVEISIIKDFKSLSQNLILDEITNCIANISKKSEIDLELIKCIVISLAGIIGNNKVHISNVFPQLQGIGLENHLKSEFNIDVLIKNDINSKAIGEYWNIDEDYKNMVYISPEKTGVGSGIIIDGKLYEGSTYGAGEVGYMIFDVDYLSSNENSKPYLENIVSKNNVLNHTTDELEFMGKYYAITIHNIATLLDPDLIILGGNFIELGFPIYQIIQRYLQKISVLPVEIRLSKIDLIAQLYGAIYFGIKYIDEKILNM